MSAFINVVIPPLADALTYALPADLGKDVSVGTQVVVPLGVSRHVNGFVISREVPSRVIPNIKSISSVVGEDPCFLPEQLDFFRWVADYYGESLSSVIDIAIPHSALPKIEKMIVLLSHDAGTKITGKLQIKIVEFLKSAGGVTSQGTLLRNFPGASAALKALSQKSVLRIDSRELTQTSQLAAPSWAKTEIDLSDDQKIALQKIETCIASDTFESFLLHGVTGSGKTEVYIEAIRYALTQGKGAIVIVPEIALTPQVVARFQARLGDAIAVLHSGLSKRSRWEAWNDLVKGKKRVAIGARSAIFAPVQNLGIVIVDEEHDGSFKQHEGLRYNARDIAIVRAKLAKGPVVLGSATPSLESYYKARRGTLTLLNLSERHTSGSSVSVEIVDLNKVKPWEMPSKNISPVLADAISEALSKGEQTFLLYNRRGFANYMQCDTCESVITCPNCSVTLTYHQFNNSLVCHYCFLKILPPTLCSACSAEHKEKPGTYVLRGSGTERTQEEIMELFPAARVLRLDRDVVSNLESYEAILNAVRNKECDILVGTQMIAKGHDLPHVTLGAVVDCDVGLHMPDFRAGEKIFQLLTQLAGRTGRGSVPGRVILQTRVPGHPSIIHAASENFEGFALTELKARQELHYPPFERLLRIVYSSKEEGDLMPTAATARALIEHFAEVKNLQYSILGPAPCAIAKLKTDWRYHIMVKAHKAGALVQLASYLKEYTNKKKTTRIIYDLDPYDML